MSRQASFLSDHTVVSVRLPKKLAGKEIVLVDAEDYARLKQRLAELEDALGKIARGETAYRERRTKIVRSLSELSR